MPLELNSRVDPELGDLLCFCTFEYMKSLMFFCLAYSTSFATSKWNQFAPTILPLLF